MRRTLLLPIALSLLTFAGCAALQRDARARELAGEYVYSKPLDEVWPHASALLISQGYTVRETQQEHVLETDWKTEVAGSRASGTYSKYTVVGKQTGAKSVVRILRSSRRSEIAEVESRPERVPTSSGEDRSSRSNERSHYGTNDDTGRVLEAPDAEGGRAVGAPRQEAFHMKPSGTRDLHMEWLLLQRADPEGAARLYEAAKGK